jgi:hypothetical protein
LSSTLKINQINRGFKNASSFLGQLTQKGLEKKGFAQSKLIINWNEIVGSELSRHSKPLKITFSKNGLGATLMIEIDGAFGPEIELQRETIKQKVNRIYGYTAISKIVFKPSAYLGYNAIIQKNLSSEADAENFEVSERKIMSGDLQELMLNLENTNNNELRKSLEKLSNNFLKQSLLKT